MIKVFLPFCSGAVSTVHALQFSTIQEIKCVSLLWTRMVQIKRSMSALQGGKYSRKAKVSEILNHIEITHNQLKQRLVHMEWQLLLSHNIWPLFVFSPLFQHVVLLKCATMEVHVTRLDQGFGVRVCTGMLGTTVKQVSDNKLTLRFEWTTNEQYWRNNETKVCFHGNDPLLFCLVFCSLQIAPKMMSSELGHLLYSRLTVSPIITTALTNSTTVCGWMEHNWKQDGWCVRLPLPVTKGRKQYI